MSTKQKTDATVATVVDATQSPYTTYGVGVRKNNPRRCCACGEPIKRGELWQRDAGAPDPEHGRIVVVRHSPHCPEQQRRNASRMKRNDERLSG